MEADAKAGRLDFLWEEAKGEIAGARTRPLDELLGRDSGEHRRFDGPARGLLL